MEDHGSWFFLTQQSIKLKKKLGRGAECAGLDAMHQDQKKINK